MAHKKWWIRKTVDVADLLERVDWVIHELECKGWKDPEEILSAFMESVLHNSGNYRGYREVKGRSGKTHRKFQVSTAIQKSYDKFRDHRIQGQGLR